MKFFNCNEIGHYVSHCNKLDQQQQQIIHVFIHHKFDNGSGNEINNNLEYMPIEDVFKNECGFNGIGMRQTDQPYTSMLQISSVQRDKGVHINKS